MPDVAPTVIVARKVLPGREREFRRWNARLQAAAAQFPGHLHSDVQPPGGAHPDEWMIVYRFASPDELEQWLSSPERAQIMADGDHLLAAPAREQRIARPEAGDMVATAVISQRVPPAAIDEFRRAQVEIALTMARFPGFLHSEVIEPVPGVQDDHVVVLSFESRAALESWLGSDDRRAVLRRLEPLVDGERTINVVDGFGGWFSPSAEQAPPRWKQAVSVLLALFPVTLTLSSLQRAFAADVPWVPALMVSNVIGISLLTWVLMPRVTRLLHGWLHA